MPEKRIISGCIAGDRHSQELLFRKYHRLMLGICLRYCQDKAEAEDILIEGFMRIYTNIRKYRGEGSFEGWMKRVMVNAAIDHHRGNLKHYFHQDIEEVKGNITGGIDPVEGIEVEELLKIIRELPEGYRLVFNLHAIEGYNHKEIAEILNISEGTSKSQLSKARKYLQKRLKGLTNNDL